MGKYSIVKENVDEDFIRMPCQLRKRIGKSQKIKLTWRMVQEVFRVYAQTRDVRRTCKICGITRTRFNRLCEKHRWAQRLEVLDSRVAEQADISYEQFTKRILKTCAALLDGYDNQILEGKLPKLSAKELKLLQGIVATGFGKPTEHTEHEHKINNMSDKELLEEVKKLRLQIAGDDMD